MLPLPPAPAQPHDNSRSSWILYRDITDTTLQPIPPSLVLILLPSALSIEHVFSLDCRSWQPKQWEKPVLENIVGKDFLPRGSGIVTRRPLVLQLINRPNSKGEVGGVAAGSDKAAGSPSANGGAPSTNTIAAVAVEEGDEWGEFLHIPGKRFTDFNDIRDEIDRETEKTTGKNAGVSSNPINLRIYSPNVLTLTLVDLPGLTKVPVGDQPKDIEKQIKDMILKYISKSNAIILAVTSANTDLANSDGLKLARDVDPEGVRTIGVLTKIDLMDQGTDVIDILAGRVIPLRLGYVPVVNRGQRDIENKKKISIALEAEKNYFENHPSYRSKAQYCGTPFLARKLNMILMHHIKNTLPEIKAKIQSGLSRFQQELVALGDPLGEDSSDMSSLVSIVQLLLEHQATFQVTSLAVVLVSVSCSMKFIAAIRSMDPFDQVKDVDIRSSPALFVGTAAFEILVKQQIKRIEDPSLKCCTMIYDELVRILNRLLQKPYSNASRLSRINFTMLLSAFPKVHGPTNKLVSDLINAEACYINTVTPEFITGHRAMAIVVERITLLKNPPPIMDQIQGKNPNERNLLHQLLLLQLFPKEILTQISSTRVPPAVLKASGTLSEREQLRPKSLRTAADLVPKAIMLNLVQLSKDELQRELLSELYKRDEFDESLKESEFTVQRRVECKKMISALKKADEIIATV
ncbi:hypothetical protein BSLG_004314 [Batrachochytrium salamandrivorans]|nr:hypothetical protein BSLG_004314 [Batrachochytrium salamandrivorans]